MQRLQSSCKNESSLHLVRITVSIESCLPIGWRTFIWWKIRQSAALFWFGLRDVRVLYSRAEIQKTIDVSPAFLEHGWTERWRFEHTQTVIQTSRRLDSFLHEAAQNFELITNIQDQKLKIKNLKRLMSFSRPIQWYHSHADPIWPDGIFKHKNIIQL